jgi:hypothetical protein
MVSYPFEKKVENEKYGLQETSTKRAAPLSIKQKHARERARKSYTYAVHPICAWDNI